MADVAVVHGRNNTPTTTRGYERACVEYGPRTSAYRLNEHHGNTIKHARRTTRQARDTASGTYQSTLGAVWTPSTYHRPPRAYAGSNTPARSQTAARYNCQGPLSEEQPQGQHPSQHATHDDTTPGSAPALAVPRCDATGEDGGTHPTLFQFSSKHGVCRGHAVVDSVGQEDGRLTALRRRHLAVEKDGDRRARHLRHFVCCGASAVEDRCNGESNSTR